MIARVSKDALGVVASRLTVNVTEQTSVKVGGALIVIKTENGMTEGMIAVMIEGMIVVMIGETETCAQLTDFVTVVRMIDVETMTEDMATGDMVVGVSYVTTMMRKCLNGSQQVLPVSLTPWSFMALNVKIRRRWMTRRKQAMQIPAILVGACVFVSLEYYDCFYYCVLSKQW